MAWLILGWEWDFGIIQTTLSFFLEVEVVEAHDIYKFTKKNQITMNQKKTYSFFFLSLFLSISLTRSFHSAFLTYSI